MCLWIFIFTLFFGRIASLRRRHYWRKSAEAGNIFPGACGVWAAANGCTRITMNDCTRPGSIPTDQSILFDVSLATLNNALG